MYKNSRLEKFTHARASMVQSQRFYGALALRLQPVETSRVETSACDGHRFFYNPDWIDATPTEVLAGVLAHTVCSLAQLHHTRRKGREKKKWQRASDLCVNPIIKKAGFTLPADALDDPRFHDKSVEEIYYELAKEEAEQQPQPGEGEDSGEGQPQSGGAGGAGAGAGEEAGEPSDAAGDADSEGQDGSGEPGEGGEEESGEGEGPGEEEEAPGDDDFGPEEGAEDTGGCGEIMDAVNADGSKPSAADITDLESQQRVAAIQAQALAKKAGHGSNGIDRMIDSLKKAQVDWHEQLRRWMLQTAKSDYTWAKPNRRFASQGITLPALAGRGMGEMAVIVDMSYSVLPWVKEFVSEVAGIREDLRPDALHLIYCTDKVEGVDTFGREEDFAPRPRGVGGTDLRAGFRWLEDQGIEPACLVVLTDLETAFDAHEPGYPVLWASTDEKSTAPWGETIYLKR
jgi:predicted metal-dependent peptidase